MSSAYRLICLSHDPGIVLDEPEWHNLPAALAAITRADTWGHADCDLVVGRYSYPLIEVICPSQCGRRRRHGLHSHDPAFDVGWLRLLHVARQDLPAKADLLVGHAAMCWPADRLRRLAPLLDIEEMLAATQKVAAS